MQTSSPITSQESVRIIPLGGVGDVTKNMYLYEYHTSPGVISDILIVDCGIGFPEENMYGIDIVIPDISYLRDKKEKIRGIVLTHGHDDHIAALPYLLPELKVPVYGSKLTAALAEVKLEELGLHNQVKTVSTDDILKIGPFSIEFIHVTHSIPDACNLIIKTPIGTFYHGSDYKFDWTPLDGKITEVGKIAQASKTGILCLLSDCVRVESPGYTLSEQVIEDTLEKEIRNCPGKFIFTTQSSNISRIQLAVNVAIKHNRKVAFLGRSIDKNVTVARKLNYINFPDIHVVPEKDLYKYQDRELALIVTGSQAQPHSALSRIAEGLHKFVKIKKDDVVVFSADPIPGYENAVHGLIDALTAEGSRVSYSDIVDELHVSGHGAINDLSLMLGLTSPQFIIPIGGTIRQMQHYSRLAQSMGYHENQVILPADGSIIEFTPNHFKLAGRIDLKNIMIDGLGVGDIGNVVLRDRQTMASDGIVIVVVPVDQNNGKVTAEPDIISRGFVYMKDSGELIGKAKKIILQVMTLNQGRIADWQFFRRRVEEKLANFLYKETHRRPLIIAVLIKV